MIFWDCLFLLGFLSHDSAPRTCTQRWRAFFDKAQDCRLGLVLWKPTKPISLQQRALVVTKWISLNLQEKKTARRHAPQKKRKHQHHPSPPCFSPRLFPLQALPTSLRGQEGRAHPVWPGSIHLGIQLQQAADDLRRTEAKLRSEGERHPPASPPGGCRWGL